MLIGREKEIKKLNELYYSGSAELVALYGRRRVGKTYLVDQVFDKRITFRHSGLSPIEAGYSDSLRRKSRMKDQLRHFYRSLKEHGMKASKCPENWLDAFYLLEDWLKEREADNNRILVFIDEIQWMDTPKSGFMTGFEAFWNGWACHKPNVMVIVCGSSTSWVLDKLVNNYGGLYDRVTYQIKLEAFSLKECELFFRNAGIEISRYDIVQSYMMVGGIPYYLKYFEKGNSFPQNIQNMFFEDNAPLKHEFGRLFSSVFSNPDVMISIVTALSRKNRGLSRSEILKQTGLADSGEFSSLLKALISGSFVTRYSSFGSSRREEYYKLTDPFCVFWLRFVKDSLNRNVKWTNIEDTASVTAWRGYAFENVCFNHIRQIKAALGIEGVSTEESMWSKRGNDDTSGTQIDLIINRKDNIVNMCEIKFCNDVFIVDKDYHMSLIRRKNLLSEVIPKRSAIHNTLITTYGLKHNEYSGDFIRTIDLEKLFC